MLRRVRYTCILRSRKSKLQNKHKAKFIKEKYSFLLLKTRIHNNEIRALLSKMYEPHSTILCTKKRIANNTPYLTKYLTRCIKKKNKQYT